MFGWTEREIVKRNLETMLLNRAEGDPGDAKPPDGLMGRIEAEVIANYQIKDWSKFAYITVEPPSYAYVVLVVVMALAQGGYWYWAFTNRDRKGSDSH